MDLLLLVNSSPRQVLDFDLTSVTIFNSSSRNFEEYFISMERPITIDLSSSRKLNRFGAALINKSNIS